MNDIDNIVNEAIFNNELIKINNELYLTNEQIKILEKYNISYKNLNLKELLYKVEYILNDDYIEDLDRVSLQLSEFNYYNFINK